MAKSLLLAPPSVMLDIVRFDVPMLVRVMSTGALVTLLIGLRNCTVGELTVATGPAGLDPLQQLSRTLGTYCLCAILRPMPRLPVRQRAASAKRMWSHWLG